MAECFRFQVSMGSLLQCLLFAGCNDRSLQAEHLERCQNCQRHCNCLLLQGHKGKKKNLFFCVVHESKLVENEGVKTVQMKQK